METRVTDSRDSDGQEAIRRRRVCVDCGRRFTTYEKVEEIPILVLKRNGGQEEFRREKMLNGLLRACTKRNVPLNLLEAAVEGIEADLRTAGVFEVTSERLGDMVMERLRDIDLVAYVRFASVYRQFESVAEFQAELERLAKGGVRQ
jgi:transcriptional repressor NrdR